MSIYETVGEGYGRRWTDVAEEMEARGTLDAIDNLLAARLCGAEEPSHAIDAVLDEAAARFRHCILFKIADGEASVWGARGWTDRNGDLRTFRASTVSGNPFELLQSNESFRGDLFFEQGYATFFEDLGLKYPEQISLIPIEVGGRRVAILYGDEGEQGKLRGDGADDRHIARRLALGLTLCVIKTKIRSMPPLSPVSAPVDAAHRAGSPPQH